MEEKKLTDEKAIFNYIANDVLGAIKPLYLRKQIVRKILDLIHRLQGENESLKKQIEELPKPRKKILANKVYSDSTLKKWSKEDLIEHIRILEHNWACAEENLNNSAKNSEKIFYEQKTEIERLTDKNNELFKAYNAVSGVNTHLNNKRAELQKQVDELKKELKILRHS